MKPDVFVQKIQNNNFSPFMGVPCSVFKSLLNYITIEPSLENYICSSEGEAMGLAAGFALSGKIPVVYMQNDGYGNAVNPLSSLQLMYKLPALMLISWRAEPGKKDAPQHKIMGDTIIQLLDTFSIPYCILSDSNLDESLLLAEEYIKTKSKPFAFIIKRGYFDKFAIVQESKEKLKSRKEYLEVLHKNIKETDILLGTTGFSGRELYQTTNRDSKFYMMGSMGCLPSIGLGIAIENPGKRIIVIDGDGALLMKLGTLSTIGFYSPNNLIHICFDNRKYESTGGQPTTSEKTNFSQIAKNCGYRSVYTIKEPERFNTLLDGLGKEDSPVFIHIQIRSGSIKDLSRPQESPEEMRDKLIKALKK